MRFFGKASSSITREEILLNGIDKRSLGLEIGPSHCPVAAKREGFNVRVLDHLDAEGLRTKYADHGVDVALAKPTNHSPGTAAEYFLKVCRKGGQIAWGEGHKGDLQLVHGLSDALQAMAQVREGHYYDLHEWVFTPESFRNLIGDLRDLRMIELEEQCSTPPVGTSFL